MEELQKLFSVAVTEVARKRKTTIFIDAIDEAGSYVAAQLVGYFHRLNEEFMSKDCWVKLCISCCHYAVVARIPGLELRVEDENSSDIEAVVRDHFQTHVIPRKTDPSFSDDCQKIGSAIVTQASGLFQWVSLAFR